MTHFSSTFFTYKTDILVNQLSLGRGWKKTRIYGDTTRYVITAVFPTRRQLGANHFTVNGDVWNVWMGRWVRSVQDTGPVRDWPRLFWTRSITRLTDPHVLFTIVIYLHIFSHIFHFSLCGFPFLLRLPSIFTISCSQDDCELILNWMEFLAGGVTTEGWRFFTTKLNLSPLPNRVPQPIGILLSFHFSLATN